MAFNERWQGVLNRPPPPPKGSLREGLQVHVLDLLAHGDGRRMGRMPLAPDAVGTDVEEFHARSAVITLSQRGDEGAVFGKVDRVGVIRFDARDSPAAAGRIAAAGGSRFSGLRNLHFEPACLPGKNSTGRLKQQEALRAIANWEQRLAAQLDPGVIAMDTGKHGTGKSPRAH